MPRRSGRSGVPATTSSTGPRRCEPGSPITAASDGVERTSTPSTGPGSPTSTRSAAARGLSPDRQPVGAAQRLYVDRGPVDDGGQARRTGGGAGGPVSPTVRRAGTGRRPSGRTAHRAPLSDRRGRVSVRPRERPLSSASSTASRSSIRPTRPRSRPETWSSCSCRSALTQRSNPATHGRSSTPSGPGARSSSARV